LDNDAKGKKRAAILVKHRGVKPSDHAQARENLVLSTWITLIAVLK